MTVPYNLLRLKNINLEIREVYILWLVQWFSGYSSSLVVTSTAIATRARVGSSGLLSNYPEQLRQVIRDYRRKGASRRERHGLHLPGGKQQYEQAGLYTQEAELRLRVCRGSNQPAHRRVLPMSWETACTVCGRPLNSTHRSDKATPTMTSRPPDGLRGWAAYYRYPLLKLSFHII